MTKLPNNYSADVPDLPGCVATGETWQEVQRTIREAVVLHVAAMREDGDPLGVELLDVSAGVLLDDLPQRDLITARLESERVPIFA